MLELEIVDFAIAAHAEEAHGPAVFEIVLDVGVLCAIHLNDKLVERIIVRPSAADGIPGIAPLHFAKQADTLGLAAVGLALGTVFYLEQQPVLLEGEDGVVGHVGLFEGQDGGDVLRMVKVGRQPAGGLHA